MTDDEWDELEGEIADAIEDSMDIDWTADIGARAVVDMLKASDYRIRMLGDSDQ